MGEKNSGTPISWNWVSKDIVSRSNKDCRKRWVKLTTAQNRGGWGVAEDQNLIEGVQIYGNKWTLVAEKVATRNADRMPSELSCELDLPTNSM